MSGARDPDTPGPWRTGPPTAAGDPPAGRARAIASSAPLRTAQRLAAALAIASAACGVKAPPRPPASAGTAAPAGSAGTPGREGEPAPPPPGGAAPCEAAPGGCGR